MPMPDRIIIERPDDDVIEIYVDDELVASANHDEHGWSGMDAVEKAALAVARALAPVSASHEDPRRLRQQLAEVHADCARYATERDEARAALAAAQPPPHLLPLLNLTADEIQAVRTAAYLTELHAPYGQLTTSLAALRSALDKLTTTEEAPDA